MAFTLAALVGLGAAACGSSENAAETVTVEVTVTEAAPPPAEAPPVAETQIVESVPDAGDLLLQYVPAADEMLQSYEDVLAGSGLLEGIVAGVNETLALPGDIVVSVEETGNPSPFYLPEAGAIVVPPEWLAFSDVLFTQSGLASTDEALERLILSSTAFVFYHELGHALIDQLDLPITGREEDAVDQLATVIVTQGGAGAGDVALAGATFFGLLAAGRQGFEAADFWDVHSLDEQRFFNIVCWVFGSDPDRYASIPAEAGLGQDRMARCPEEYAQTVGAWQTLLAPHLL